MTTRPKVGAGLKGSILCKEIEIQDLEVKLSNRNCQIQRLKYCRDQFNEVKNIMEESVVLDSIVKSISIKRIYAEKEIAEDVKRKIKELQGN